MDAPARSKLDLFLDPVRHETEQQGQTAGCRVGSCKTQLAWNLQYITTALPPGRRE